LQHVELKLLLVVVKVVADLLGQIHVDPVDLEVQVVVRETQYLILEVAEQHVKEMMVLHLLAHQTFLPV
jgi:RNase P/RNase MRP subunit POP5